jgi:acetyl-CoA carboxylase biotin carboxyl carrier protein
MSDGMHSISSIVELLRKHGIDEFELSDGIAHLKIVLPPAETDATGHASAVTPRFYSSSDVEVVSPGTGTFVARHPAKSKDFVEVGDIRAEGECIALIQTGTIYRPVVAPCTGKILRRLCNPGDDVDYSFPLFTMHRQTTP